MIEPEHLEPLLQRQTTITKRMADLETRAEKIAREREGLLKESEEIATTLSTLAKIYGVQIPDQPEIKSGRSTGGASTKPEGAPTLFGMVEAVLADHNVFEDENFTLEANEIFENIRRRWWPDAPRNSIIPSLWRFAQEGRLRKEGTAYGHPLRAPPQVLPNAATEEEDEF